MKHSKKHFYYKVPNASFMKDYKPLECLRKANAGNKIGVSTIVNW